MERVARTPFDELANKVASAGFDEAADQFDRPEAESLMEIERARLELIASLGSRERRLCYGKM